MNDSTDAAAESSPRPRRLGWANLLARVFAVDVTVCRKCGGRMRILEVVTDPDDIARILHRARAPPRPHPPGQLRLFADRALRRRVSTPMSFAGRGDRLKASTVLRLTIPAAKSPGTPVDPSVGRRDRPQRARGGRRRDRAVQRGRRADRPVRLILTDDVVDQSYDPAADPEKLVFPAQTSLAATGFLVLPKGADPGQHPFGLSADGDTVTLLRLNLEVVDQVSYAATEADESYCRLPDGPTGPWTAG